MNDGLIPGIRGWWALENLFRYINKSCSHLNRCRKTFNKMRHPSVIKTLNKLGIERNFLSLIEVIHENQSN